MTSPWGLPYRRWYYLVGPEQGRARPVLWRLGRIAAPQPARPATPPPDGWSIGDYAARSLGVSQERRQAVALRFSAAAQDVGQFLFHPSQAMEPQADGSLLVRFTADGMVELARHLLGWGVEVEVLAPEGVRRLLCKVLEARLGHHEVPPPVEHADIWSGIDRH